MGPKMQVEFLNRASEIFPKYHLNIDSTAFGVRRPFLRAEPVIGGWPKLL